MKKWQEYRTKLGLYCSDFHITWRDKWKLFPEIIDFYSSRLYLENLTKTSFFNLIGEIRKTIMVQKWLWFDTIEAFSINHL